MKSKIMASASKVGRRKKIKRYSKIALLIILLLLLLFYIISGIIYNNGNFSITLDRNLYFDRGLIIYDDPEYKVFRTELYAKSLEYFDNISYKWLPKDLHESEGGSHNGNNYMAYTFYIENQGDLTTDYWSEIVIDDVIKNVDEAVRIRVYLNDEEVTYAKAAYDGSPEPNTIPFVSDTLIAFEHVENFKPGDCNKYTIVMWLEGSDLECTDNLLGGEIKIHMNFVSEIVELEGEGKYAREQKTT